MKKAHAVHNEQVCDLLIQNGQFNDWVITAAFYSALHLVQHQIFPINFSGKPYSNFNRYYAIEVQRKRPTKSKHKAIKELVIGHLNACSNSYRWLYDNCMSARYNNFHVSQALAAKAKLELEAIKSVCTKP